MEAIITVVFIAISLGILFVSGKAKNPIAVVHIAFFIIFMELLHLAGLFEGNNQHYDIAYYLLAQISILLYLVIFTFGLLWLRTKHLIPSQERFFNSAVNIGDSWLIAAFCGWFLIKAYLVTKYGVSAFSLFRQMAGKDAVLHYYAWWETPLEMYLRAFAVGASVVYVIKAALIHRYWRTHWRLSSVFLFFMSVYIGTHSSIVGPRRFMILLVLIGLVSIAWKKGETVKRFFSIQWRTVIVSALILLGLALYYQSVRNNFFQPIIAEKLLSGNPVTFLEGMAQGLVPIANSNDHQTKFLRTGPFTVIYQVIERRGDDNRGTGGAITANAFRMVMPRIIYGSDKKDLNVNDFFENEMDITARWPYIVSDIAGSLLAIFMADFGFFGVLIAPMVMLFWLAVFFHIPRKGLLAHPVMVLFFFSTLLNLAANVEGTFIPVLGSFRNAIILAVILLPFSLLRNGLVLKQRRYRMHKMIPIPKFKIQT